jgi:hypothetical protein
MEGEVRLLGRGVDSEDWSKSQAGRKLQHRTGDMYPMDVVEGNSRRSGFFSSAGESRPSSLARDVDLPIYMLCGQANIAVKRVLRKDGWQNCC